MSLLARLAGLQLTVNVKTESSSSERNKGPDDDFNHLDIALIDDMT
jgi:hypothetical protein